MSAAVVSGPSNGILILNPDGSFVYTPNPGFIGTDTFVYRVHDGNLGWAEATVTIEAEDPIEIGDEFFPESLDRILLLPQADFFFVSVFFLRNSLRFF